MMRSLVVLFGLVELLVPNRFIEFFEGFVVENPEECSRREWVSPVARLEGLVFIVAAFRPGKFSGMIRSTLGCYGLMAVISPQGYLDYWIPLIYEDAERCEWKPWIAPLTRVVGALYVLIALFGWRSKTDTSR